MKRFLFSMLFLYISLLSAQQKEAQQILDAVKNKFEKVKDYEVDVEIKLDITGVKVPDTKAKIFFKQPDKVHVESAGFAMLPKQSTNFSPVQFLKGDYTAIYIKQETISGTKLDVVKVIPSSDSSDVVLSTLWIDSKQDVIHKIETTGRRSGSILTEIKYEKENQGLPSEVKFSFNAGDPETPKVTEKQNEDDNDRRRRRQNISGSVIMKYSNYKINKGIQDSVFEKKK